MKLYGLDVETECAVPTCTDSECKHALDQNRNKITLIAVTDGLFEEHVFTQVTDFNKWLNQQPAAMFTMHNGKFDVKQLVAHGGTVTFKMWAHDSSLLAFNYEEKIDEGWLDEYEAKRRELNKLRTGMKHREARHFSLKTLAPYFLKVKPFWEPEGGHNDQEYVLLDARYCLQLTQYFLERMDAPSLNFYKEKHLPWTKNLTLTELQGISINKEKLYELWEKSIEAQRQAEVQIASQWKHHFDAWRAQQEAETKARYSKTKEELALKGRATSKMMALTEAREMVALSKIEPLNLASPKQLLWLLRDRLELDVVNLDGRESTDKETLKKLGEDNPEVAVLLEYRKHAKLCSTYYPEYLQYMHEGRIHASFNTIGTRTGRLSSSNPNVQQVPGELHAVFQADPKHTLITRDLSAIEPTVLAYYSEDPQLCELMLNKGDFHSTNAKAMFNLECSLAEIKETYGKERKIAKEIGLAVLYGAGRDRVFQVLAKHGMQGYTLSDAKKFVYRIRDLYAGVWRFKTNLDKELESGATIFNLLGRPLKIPVAQDVYMQGLNTLIQSSASDLLQYAGDIITNEGNYQVLLLVHDEIVVQVPDNEVTTAVPFIEEAMTKRVKLTTGYGQIPIRVEGKEGKTWTK